ncbi:hypothetical protein PINS_up004192 [Pythium insidiosum]|nr:hypothetical protein PINS_up004192 [Pythium insidiosum]
MTAWKRAESPNNSLSATRAPSRPTTRLRRALSLKQVWHHAVLPARHHNPIKELKFHRGIQYLVSLNVERTQIQSIENVSLPPSLRMLNVEWTNIDKLVFHAGLNNLDTLYAWGSQTTTFEVSTHELALRCVFVLAPTLGHVKLPDSVETAYIHVHAPDSTNLFRAPANLEFLSTDASPSSLQHIRFGPRITSLEFKPVPVVVGVKLPPTLQKLRIGVGARWERAVACIVVSKSDFALLKQIREIHLLVMSPSQCDPGISSGARLERVDDYTDVWVLDGTVILSLPEVYLIKCSSSIVMFPDEAYWRRFERSTETLPPSPPSTPTSSATPSTSPPPNSTPSATPTPVVPTTTLPAPTQSSAPTPTPSPTLEMTTTPPPTKAPVAPTNTPVTPTPSPRSTPGATTTSTVPTIAPPSTTPTSSPTLSSAPTQPPSLSLSPTPPPTRPPTEPLVTSTKDPVRPRTWPSPTISTITTPPPRPSVAPSAFVSSLMFAENGSTSDEGSSTGNGASEVYITKIGLSPRSSPAPSDINIPTQSASLPLPTIFPIDTRISSSTPALTAPIVVGVLVMAVWKWCCLRFLKRRRASRQEETTTNRSALGDDGSSNTRSFRGVERIYMNDKADSPALNTPDTSEDAIWWYVDSPSSNGMKTHNRVQGPTDVGLRLGGSRRVDRVRDQKSSTASVTNELFAMSDRLERPQSRLQPLRSQRGRGDQVDSSTSSNGGGLSNGSRARTSDDVKHTRKCA